MVGHGELHHARGTLLLGQFQTGAVPTLEHAGLGVLVCGGLELCTHGHSRQVGNSAAVLQGDLCIGDLEFIGLGSVCDILRVQRNLVCGHLEGNGRTVDVRISRQTGCRPTSEGVTFLLECGGNEFCARRHSRQVGNIAAVLQGDLCIGDLEFIRRSNEHRHQIHIMVGHGEVHHACGALFLGQVQTSPALEHTGLGVLVCDSLELCTHRHSLQVGNIAAILQENLCIFDLELMGLGFGIGIRRRNLFINRGDLHIVCGHREGDGLAAGIHRISGQTRLDLPIFEGHAIRLPCGKSDFLTNSTLFRLPVHSQGVGVLGVLRGQGDIVCGHLEGNGCLGGVHISGQTSHFPTGEGLAFHRLCNNRNVLIKDTQFVLPVHGQSIGVLLVLRGQRDVVCGHLEADGLAGGVRTLGHAIYLPTSEGAAFLLGCGKRDFLTKCTAFFLPVHGQGVVDRLIVVRHPHVIAGHEELEFDMRAGICDGIRILCQTFDLPDNVIAFLLVSAKGDLIAHVLLHAFLTIPVVLRLGRLGHNIGAYLINSVIILGVGVSNVVLTRRHLDVHSVAAGGGGNRLALVGAVQQGHLRVGIVIIIAFVFHRVLGGIVGKVLSHRRVADRILTYNNRTGLVLFAFLCNDSSLVTAIRIGHLVDKGLAFVYTGKALKLDRKLTNTFHIGAGHRAIAVIVHVDLKVIQLKALKGQLFGYGVSIRQLVTAAVVVIVILHSKPDVVGACLGGHRFRSRRQVICSAVLKGSLRDCVAIILRAGIGCRTGVEVKAEVPYRRPIFAHNRFFYNQNAAGRVPLALRGLDVYLIAAVLGLGREVVKLCFVVGAHTDEAQLAHALLIAGNDRVLYSPLKLKVALLQGREGQLFAVRDSIGVHFVLGAIVVVTVIHHDADRVGACLGRLRHRRGRAIRRDILDGILRSIVKIHLAGIVCSLGLGVILKVGELRLISAYHLADIKRAFCVLVALFRDDALLVDAI